MTDIEIRPSRAFDLSLSDRSHPGGPWLNSFIGVVKFTGDQEVEEKDVSIVFILLALIETSILVREFGSKPRAIPIPSTDRELIIEANEGATLSFIRSGNEKLFLNIPLTQELLRNMFGKLVELMGNWQPARKDDKYFIRSNWLLADALDRAQGQGLSSALD